MILCKWEDLPRNIQTGAIRPYYDFLSKKQGSLVLKRCFDFITSLLMLILLSPVLLVLAILIKVDSKGTVMFRQIRVTQYGKEFCIFKFRTMAQNAEKAGAQITTRNDARVTRIGKFLRKCKLDELPQLLNILAGEMSFVGTRPEVPRYVECYTDEMRATLLLPAGVTSQASIAYKNEEQLIAAATDVDAVYINEVLPEKMKCNLQALLSFSFLGEIKVMIGTVLAVIDNKTN